MVRVDIWRGLVLSLSLSSLLHVQHSEASISIIERDIEPATFVTTAATSSTEPLWLVLPLLLDVQPVLLKLDVTRHVPTQIQNFCREHGMGITRCAGAIQEAVDEVVNLQRFCKKAAVESALPGFVVTKNVIKESSEATSTSWLQNDPQDVAIDFCGFAKTEDKCVEALGKTLQMTFDWMLALTPCEQQTEGSEEVTASHSEVPSVADRLASVEEMIAALQSSSRGEEVLQEQPKETEEDSSATGSVHGGDATEETNEIEEAVPQSEDEASEVIKTRQAATQPEDGEGVDESDKVATTQWGSVTGADTGNDSCEVSYTPRDSEGSRIVEKASESRKSWEVGAALVLVLVILHLAIDWTIPCVRYLADCAGAPKEFDSVRLHNILRFLSGSTLNSAPLLKNASSKSDVMKKPPLQPLEESASTSTQERPKQPQATTNAPQPLTTFSCAALIMPAVIINNSISLAQDQQTTSSLVQDSNEALHIIQQKYERKVAAAQRIQHAWKAAQRKSLRKREWESFFNAICMSGSSSAPIFPPLPLKDKKLAQTPPGMAPPALRRLVSGTCQKCLAA